MKDKFLAAVLSLLLTAAAAAAQPGPPPPPPQGAGGPGGPPPSAPGPRPGPAPGPGPARPMPPRPGGPGPAPAPGPVPARPMAPRPGGPGPAPVPGPGPIRPMPPRPGGPGPIRPIAPRPGYPAPMPRPMRPVGPPPPMPRPYYYRPGPVLPPGPPPGAPGPWHAYRRYRPGWYDGGYYDDWFGVGVVLGTILNQQEQANTEAREAARLAQIENVRSSAADTAARQSDQITQIIAEVGPEKALSQLNDYWHDQGQATFLDARTPVSMLRVVGFQQNLTIVYTTDARSQNVSVTVTAPDYNVSETVTSAYRLPQPVLSKDAERLLGFSVNDAERSPEGFLLVKNVVPATAAAYVGIRNGARLYSVDGSSTAEVSAAQLNAYVERRAGENATIEVVFSGGKGKQSARIKL